MGGFPSSSTNKLTRCHYILRVPCGFFPYDCTSHVTSKETLSSHMGCPAHPSGSWLHYAARQAGMKEPMLLKRGIIAGLIRACRDQCCCQCAFWGQETAWLPVTIHPCSLDQSSGNANLLTLTAAGSPRGMLCRASFSFHRYHLKMTPQVLPVPYSRLFWESISAGSAVQLSQLPYGWTKLALLRRVWRNTTDVTSWKVLLYQSRNNSLQLWNPQAPRETPMLLPCFHKNIFLVFPEILIHYLSKILWLFLRTWPAVFPSGSLLTIMSFSVHIQLDTLQLCAFQWLPNVH